MIKNSLKKIFWGFLALRLIPLFFQPVIYGYTIPLQSIGFIIILIGIIDLENKNEYFKKTKIIIYFLILLSLFNIVRMPATFEEAMEILSTPFMFMLGMISFIAELLFTYNILMGLGDLTYEFDYISLSKKAKKFWGYYWKLILALFVTILISFVPTIAIVLLLIVAISVLVLQISIIKLFWDSSQKSWVKKDKLNEEIDLE